MISPLTIVLVKVFAKGFYKAHADLIMVLVVMVVSYCFFIEALNQTHLPSSEIKFYNLLIVLTVITSPAVLVFVLFLWMIINYKSIKYIQKEIYAPQNEFVRYSSTALTKPQQFKSWFATQLVIALPFLIFSLFAFIVGLIYGYLIIPLALIAFVFSMCGLSAWHYVTFISKPNSSTTESALLKISRKWRKPHYTFFLYHVIHKLPASLIITKAISVFLLIASNYAFTNIENPSRTTLLIVLVITASHAMLIYDWFRFEMTYLKFIRNLPEHPLKSYFRSVSTFLLLTLPELIWIAIQYGMISGASSLMIHVGFAMMIRTCLYIINLNLKRYFYLTFTLFAISYIAILYDLALITSIASIAISACIYFKAYYKTEASASNK